MNLKTKRLLVAAGAVLAAAVVIVAVYIAGRPEGPTGAPDAPQGPSESIGLVSGWDDLFEPGSYQFKSNEAAYGMARSQWHNSVGQPALSQASYYEESLIDIYYDFNDETGCVIELHYDKAKIDAGEDPTPESIRMHWLDNMAPEFREDIVIDEKITDALSGGSLGATRRFMGQGPEELLEIFGEPDKYKSEPGKWGWYNWSVLDYTISASLDRNGNVMCVTLEKYVEPDEEQVVTGDSM